jgi:poly(beta-D-mannuronate) lyase
MTGAPAAALLVLAVPLAAQPALARERLVRSATELASAIAAAAPGDTIVLANGVWRDVDIRLEASGTAARPITLRAQRPGQVVISGRSAVRVAGRHLVVRDLVFRGGQPLAEAAIVTRIGTRWAEDTRFTGIVIDRFSNPDRRREDHWVALYGRNIRFDHSHIAGKQNAGATFVVIRMPGWPLDNRIRIDRNHFGPRPVLGSNTGETIRIGTSEESLSVSGSVVENNIFERCDGEVEIVSIKSGGNVIRGNLFLESQGAVVLRHGNGNLVESNIFLGGGADNTGGVRIINRDQVVRNNYLEGLAGTNFTAALALMSGVPNSAINRYHQVVGGEVANNTLIKPAAILFGAGASAERSAAPEGITLSRNLVVADKAAPFRIDAPTGGIRFAGNVTDVAAPGEAGFVQRSLALRRAANGLLYPVDPALSATGAARNLRQLRRAEVGPKWYRPPAPGNDRATVRKVDSVAALVAALAAAQDSDVIDLGSGRFELGQALPVQRRVTLTGNRARLSFRSDTLFSIEEGGSLTLRGMDISGELAPLAAGNAVIRSARQSMLTNYVIDIADTRFSGLARSPGFDLVATTPATLAARIRIAASEISDLSGAIVAAAAERGTAGLYPAERIELERLQLNRVGLIGDVLRQGTDESTFGPRLMLSRSQISDSGALRLSGVQVALISDNNFVRSGGISVTHSVGEPLTRITGNTFTATPPPRVTELHFAGPPRVELRDNQTQ